VNVAIVVSPASGDGECGAHGCLVPIASGGTGWTKSDGRIHLPKAVCTNHNVLEVVASTTTVAASASRTCASFTTSAALCGPWSSVAVGTGSGISPDGGAAKDATTHDAPRDSSKDSGTSNDSGAIDARDAAPHPPTCSACEHGTCIGSRCLVTLVTGQPEPIDLVLHGSRVYWTNYSGALSSVDKDGGDLLQLVPDAGVGYGIAIDDNYVYWANAPVSAPGTIMRAGLDGSAPTALATEQDTPYYVAVLGPNVFWATQGATVGKVTVDGGGLLFISTQASFLGAIAAGDGGVYWLAGSLMQRASADGTSVSSFPSNNMTSADGLVVRPTRVYWTGSNGNDSLMSAGLDGSAPRTLISDAGAQNQLAVDDTHAYWTTTSSTTPNGVTPPSVVRVALDGGAPEILAQGVEAGVGNHLGIVVDDASVYWVNSLQPGGIMKLTPK